MIYYKAGLIRIRDAVNSDTFELREADKREVWKSHHRTLEQALVKGYRESIMCFTVEYKGKPIAMFGLVPHTILGKSASIWLLASPEMDKLQYVFKHSRRFIALMLSHYSILENYVDAGNIQTIKWLKWCGAKLGSIVPYGVEQQPFQHFEFRRSDK